MKKTGIAVILVLLEIASLSYAIDISPQIMNITGESGDFVIQTIEIYNDIDKTSIVNISIIGISNYYIQKTTYVLKPYERKTITFGITVDGSTNGIIQYECNGEITTQFVYVNSEKTVMVFPQKPKAGSSVAIISTTTSTASGLIFVSETGNQYPVTLTGIPITFVNISKNDYGSAVLMLIWDDREITYNYFNITKLEQQTDDNNNNNDELTLSVGDENIHVGNSRIIVLKLGNVGVAGDIIVTKPSGNMIIKETNNNGQAQIIFDEVGTWVFLCNYGDKTISKTVNVIGGDVDIDLPDDILVGKECEIDFNVDTPLSVEITSPEGIIEEFDVDDGSLVFIPEEGGRYDLEITTTGYDEKIKFYAYHEVYLDFKKGFTSLSYFDNIKKGEQYTVLVKDKHTNDVISDAQITINGIETINSGDIWIPRISGDYQFLVTGDYIISNYFNEHVVSGSSGGINLFYILLIIVACILFILLILKKKGILPFFSKVPKLGGD